MKVIYYVFSVLLYKKKSAKIYVKYKDRVIGITLGVAIQNEYRYEDKAGKHVMFRKISSESLYKLLSNENTTIFNGSKSAIDFFNVKRIIFLDLNILKRIKKQFLDEK